MKVTLICNYFGAWPVWFSFFLESCRKNPDFNWLIYTDCKIPNDCPENVVFHGVSFQEYCRLVSGALDLKFEPESAYKLCDIKPALGLIHQEDIKDSDFWGYSDIDVIYGQLNTFFTQEKMENYQLISSGSRRVWGFLCLLENSKFGRELFKNASDWRAIFEDPNHHAFDEKQFSDLFVKHKNLPPSVRKIVSRLYPYPKVASMEDAWSNPGWKYGWIDGSHRYPSTWFWDDGVLTNDIDDREFPYLHFIHWKTEWSKSMPTLASFDDLKDRLRWEMCSDGVKTIS